MTTNTAPVRWEPSRDLIDAVAFAIPGSVPTTTKAREIAKRVIGIVRDSLASAPPSAPAPVAGDAVAALPAEWRKEVRTIYGQGPTGSALLHCAARLESVIAQDHASQASAPSAPVGVDVPQLAEQARAWELVFCTLEEVSPGWRDGKEPAMYQAAKAIRALSQQPAAPSGEAVGSDDRRERLLERRNVLNNSFGNGAYEDGRVQQQIDAIDAELAALAAPQQPTGVDGAMVERAYDAWCVVADVHEYHVANGREAVEAALTAALAAQQQGGAE